VKHYVAFLLRIWRTAETGAAGVHASLEDPACKEILGFDNLDALFEYLREVERRLSQPEDNSPDPAGR